MIIQSKKVWIADQFVPAAIEVKEGKIVGIFPYGAKDVDDDYGNKRIVPGFMDIHCHGAYEFDTNDANEEGLRYWAEHIVSEGVTSFLATTITQSVEVLTNAVANVARVMEGGYDGAEILGIHFEGPYLDMKYKGAQPDQYIVKPTIEQFEHYQKAARGHIRYVTLATEHDEDFALTRYLTAHGVVVSIGHSGATYEQAVMAYANGARSMTHVYNGMSPFNHRANGLVGAAYRIRTMYGEIICDGCHSTPAALNNYFMSKVYDPDKMRKEIEAQIAEKKKQEKRGVKNTTVKVTDPKTGKTTEKNISASEMNKRRLEYARQLDEERYKDERTVPLSELNKQDKE